MRSVAAAVLGLLMLVGVAQARHRSHTSAPEDFDYYLLSLSIAPSFCALSPSNQGKDECQSLTQADFELTPLTLHGLWPNQAGVSVNLQPHDCEGPPFAVSGDVQAGLRRLMPAGPGLERYEWRKHGTCSGLPPEQYFAMMARLGGWVNDVIGDVIRSGSVRVADLVSAAAKRDRGLAGAIVADCRTPRGGGEALLGEVRVVLSKDFRPIPATSVGLGQNSGCPGGIGRVPASRR